MKAIQVSVGFLVLALVLELAEAQCRDKRLVVYKLTFTGLWSEETFPKAYPHYRPPAQFSQLIGRSHNMEYNIFRIGDLASAALKEFAEDRKTEHFDVHDSQGNQGVYDLFNVKNITAEGQSHSLFFANDKHSKLSVVARIIPSPDWFIGLDSIDLCTEDGWIEELSLDLHPHDAGTLQGFTFTSPTWAEKQPKPIYQITSQYPRHPANSLYYPHLDELPPLARVSIRTVSGAEGADIGEPDDTSALAPEPEVALPRRTERTTRVTRPPPTDPPTTRRPVTPRRTPRPTRRSWRYRTRGTRRRARTTEAPVTTTTESVSSSTSASAGGFWGSQTQYEFVDCNVSEWSEWSECSKTCGFGQQVRTREITIRPRGFGRKCPSLTEENLCGTMRTCGWKPFSSSFWSRSSSRGNNK